MESFRKRALEGHGKLEKVLEKFQGLKTVRTLILMTCHYPELRCTCDRLKQVSHAARPIQSTTQIGVVTRHQYGISALVPQTSFPRGETTDGVAKYWPFSQAIENDDIAQS